MKILTSGKAVETTLNTKSEKFGIDPAVIPALFDNIYKNKIRTLTQEYLSNARDANREIKQTRPIEVVLPSEFEPSLIIRDFGPGISPDRMYQVFIVIGNSTKRDTNTQTGGFGVGCKSYFSYGETFHVHTFVEGVHRQYTCWKDSEKQLHIDFHEELTQPTTEANGTKIILPVAIKDIQEFREGIIRACYFWKQDERPIIKGLSEEAPFHKEGLRVGAIEIINEELPYYVFASKSTFCLIDGIPYPLNEGIREKVPQIKNIESLMAYSSQVAIHLNNGAVRVALSREDIDNSKRSISSLQEILDLTLPKLESKKNSLLKYDDLRSFIKAVKEAKSYFKIDIQKFNDYSYNGSTISSPQFKSISIDRTSRSYRGNKINHQILTGIEDTWIDSNLLFYRDISEDTPHKTKRKIKQFVEKNGQIIIFDKKEYLKPDPNDSTNDIKVSTEPYLKGLIEIFGIKPLSSLEIKSTPSVSKKHSTKTKKTEVSLHIFKYESKEPRRIDLTDSWINDPNNLFVYLDLSSYSSFKQEISELYHHLNESEYSLPVFVFISPIELNKVSNLNFVSYEDYKKQFKPNEKQIRQFYYDNLKNCPVVKRIQYLNINNNEIKNLIDSYKEKGILKENRSSFWAKRLPSFINQRIREDDKVKESLEIDEKMNLLIQDQFSLLLILKDQYYFTFKQKEDLENYINRGENNE